MNCTNYSAKTTKGMIIKMDKKVRVTVLIENLAGKIRNIRAHHGLSFLFDIEYPGGHTFKLLFDTGTNGHDLLNNMQVLNIDPDTIDAAMISHKHHDHSGGLPQLLEVRKKPITVFVGKDFFVPAFSAKPWKIEGVEYSRSELENKGAVFVELQSPYEISSDLFISGKFNQVDPHYENIQGYTRIINGRPEEEHQQEEIALYITEGERVHVFSGCSHSGIVNICRDALLKTDREKIGLIMGGFHFVNSSIATIKDNIKELQKFDPLAVLAGHCTGFPGLSLLFNAFGKRFSRYACSDRFNLIRD